MVLIDVVAFSPHSGSYTRNRSLYFCVRNRILSPFVVLFPSNPSSSITLP